MVVVLSLVFTILTVTLSKIHTPKPPDSLNQFISTLEQDIFSMQQHAITYQSVMSLVFNLDEHYYYIYGSSHVPTKIKRSYDPNISIEFSSITQPIQYNALGTLKNPGTLKVNYNNQSVKLIFPFGTGRFYVSEE
ncbi:hypothetical protein EDC24_0521 [Aquisalibacillus elongatus]|uniref:Competence protein ComGD n=2 Tax=Aquisalibacillus elongatus TaxID=485577 RepID=A0A3N5C0P3_9BACI|nr:hypothetical protein EDC24_0521 [Aquisalibacillus elongatus]